MITVLFRTGQQAAFSEVVVADKENLLDLLHVFEGTARVIEYAIIDSDYRTSAVTSLNHHYGWNVETFPKFKAMSRF